MAGPITAPYRHEIYWRTRVCPGRLPAALWPGRSPHPVVRDIRSAGHTGSPSLLAGFMPDLCVGRTGWRQRAPGLPGVRGAPCCEPRLLFDQEGATAAGTAQEKVGLGQVQAQFLGQPGDLIDQPAQQAIAPQGQTEGRGVDANP